MKKIAIWCCLLLFFACGSDNVRIRNPFLPDYSFSVEINLNLPSFSGLNSNINPQLIPDMGSGVTLIVMKVSDTDYRAWDALCPNQFPTSCSQLTISGINAVCPCDDFEYSLFTGVGTEGEYTLKPYRVQVINPRLIRVYN
jgi:nitrite reductase/ring-hydroxylating ferredoxin subunit